MHVEELANNHHTRTYQTASAMITALRKNCGWTQEKLADHSGISVRTIRNLESGRIAVPRASTINLLLDVLDPSLAQRMQTQRREITEAMVPKPEREASRPQGGGWRGPRPPRTPLVGREAEVEQLARTVLGSPLTLLTGPGGVGKSRLAAAVAEAVGHRFADGVAVAQLGTLPREDGHNHYLAPALDRVTSLFRDERGSAPHRMLLILDDTEHLPYTTSLLVEHLFATAPDIRILVTSRQPTAMPESRIREVAPLPDAAAVELLARRLPDRAPALDFPDAAEKLAELCRELDGIPRLLEFAAYRLRTASVTTLLSSSGFLNLLQVPDFLALPHQRSLDASMRWSLDMLSDGRQELAIRLAKFATTETGELIDPPTRLDDVDGTILLAELANASLLQVSREEGRYTYRMMRHVRRYLMSLEDCAEKRKPADFG
jgi:predicted ATPase/transcriptional regulator with XRE-family HTH domain